MPFENGRFALLAVLCGLAAQSLSPSGGAGIRAAVVHRQNKTAANQFARRDIGEVADYDATSLHHNQATFSFPWSKQSNEVVSFSAVLSFWAWLTYEQRDFSFLLSIFLMYLCRGALRRRVS
jgi:hypothetical protein